MNSVSKSDIDKKIGKVLREFRLKNKLTQEDLAEKLGISLKYISRIENGNNGVKTENLIKYMNLLGITPNVIFKPFINNKEIVENVKISEKIDKLSKEKKEFVKSVINLLEELN